MKTIQGYTYKVGEYIGKGYSSTVHKGLNDKNGEEVSIKVIEMAKLEDPINQMLLQLEVSALKALSMSKHVLHLFDVYATRNNTYLITELCQGDMNMIIKQRKTFPYYQAVEIMRQLIVGYHDIHKAGYIHRDIKPANIFYKNGIYKYGDFGFAIPYNDLQHHKNYNVGSPVYMPPEALKENVYSVSCDIWALGIIFYQLLKGSVPWRAVSQQVLYDKIVSQPIQHFTVGLPEVARAFLSQVLSLDPKLRPQPEALLSWPFQLQSAPIDIRTISPNEQRGRSNVLRQINSNTVIHGKKSGIYFNQNLTPQNQSNYLEVKKTSAYYEPIKVQPVKNEYKESNDQKNQDEEHKQAYFFAENFINYINFLDRVLRFVQSSSKQQLKSLERSISTELFQEIEHLNATLSNKNQNVLSKLAGWSDFTRSPKCESLSSKLKACEKKYRMFYDSQQKKTLTQKDIMQGINFLMFQLEENSCKAKVMVAADYLVTLYQLLHLRNKYQPCEFIKMSKIELIMQGNPYNAVPEHLEKIKKKLLLISP